MVFYDSELWISASQLLCYMGAVVGYGEDEDSPTHLTVTMPYTICDLIVEYIESDTSDGVYSESMRTCGINNGTIYYYSDLGQEITAAQKGDYDLLGSGTAGVYNDANDTIIQLGHAQIVDGKAYYMLHLAKLNTGEWMSWREEYVRDMTVLYCKDRKTGTVTVLYQC